MISHPKQYEAIQADPNLLDAAFDEMMRTHPPLPGLHRTTTREYERVYEQPDTFNIFRDTKAIHVGFGMGPHYCLGAQLARLETVAASRELLKLLKNPRFKPGTTASPISSRPGVCQLLVEFDT